jgi:uncharacterized protein YkwD
MGYASPANRVAARAQTLAAGTHYGVCVLRRIRYAKAAFAIPFESLRTLLSRHRAVTRVLMAALSFTVVIGLSQPAPVTQAGREPTPTPRESLLPQAIGAAIPSDDAITLTFDSPMDPGSVEAALQLLPAQSFTTSWTPDATQLTLAPEGLWRTDTSYLAVVGSSALTSDGQPIARPLRFGFTTQTAPAVSDFQVKLADDASAPIDPEAVASTLLEPDAEEALRVAPDAGLQPPTDTAKNVSATSAITVSFSAAMDPADVESHFSIAPEVAGAISWDGSDLVFTPSERLTPGARYTISIVGSHDLTGNVLGGEGNFSFIVQPGAQLTRSEPGANATDVEPAWVVLWFSQPMDVDATNAAFGLRDTTTGSLVGGHLSWNETATQLVYTPDNPFAGGRAFEVGFGDGARDVDGNLVTASLSFTTKAGPPISRAQTSVRSGVLAVPAPAAATGLEGYAVDMINASRAAYGFAPVVLDATISAVASAHAHDQAANGYFSHIGLNGSTRESRLAAGGISFGWSGENQCYLVGSSLAGTLEWCHAQFMSEPYPGFFNHIGNVLSPHARRVGVGIAQVGGKIVVVWDFAD